MIHHRIELNLDPDEDVWIDLNSTPIYMAPDDDDPDLWTISIEPREGFRLIDILRAAKRFAVREQAKVEFAYNGHPFIVYPDSEVDGLTPEYLKRFDKEETA